ncbi:MAG: hypothetical protein B5M52_01065 [Helicobacteraceae bacterium 4484_230]|nr:MAG: hypothetical protein B5M52_01065 [Helicobacteraceae bacterium 4484_230]
MDSGLKYPKKILCTAEYLLIVNSGADELWQCDYDGSVVQIYSDFKEPLGMICKENLLYVVERESRRVACIDLQLKKPVSVTEESRQKYLFLTQKTDVSVCDEQICFIEKESSVLGCIENGQEHIYIGKEDDLLSHPEGLVCGVIGDGCGGGRLFIADTGNNRVVAYDPQSGRIITLMENLHKPCGVGKKSCHLYVSDTNTHQILRFDLSSMKAETFLS